jgi:hypothetical protein
MLKNMYTMYGGMLKVLLSSLKHLLQNFKLFLENVSHFTHKLKYLKKNSGTSAIILSGKKLQNWHAPFLVTPLQNVEPQGQ